MIRIATHLDHPVRSMQIAGDHEKFLKLLCKHSDSVKSLDIQPDDFDLYQPKQFCLDPGGMMSQREPWLEREIEGVKFTMQASKASYILQNLDKGWNGAAVPGWKRFANWHFAAAMTDSMFTKVYAWTLEIVDSDEAMNESLTMELVKDDLVNRNYLTRNKRE